ncbi:TolC family protein [Providencia rettgeri]|uniref:TolC family protein n=1 Tax=Providencia rettgeri TaxID=587 RepID=UPI00236162C5|nr:TolC family protein [Providencia rettgeri]
MNKKTTLLVGFLFSSMAVSAGAPLSLSEAIHLADEYSFDVKKVTFEAKAAAARVDQAYAAYWPKIDLIAKTNNVRTGESQDYSASSDQLSQINAALLYTLYDFGVRSAQVDAAKYALESSEIKVALQKEILIYDTFSAFIQYDSAVQQEQLSLDYLNQVKQLQQLINQRVAAGFSARSDKVRGDLALSEAKSRVEMAQQSRQESEIALKNMLGVPVSGIDSLLTPAFSYEGDVNKISLTVQQVNPAIKMMRANMNMAASKVDSVEAERYPNISVSGTYRTDFNRNNFPGSEAYVQLTVPLTDGGLLRARVSEAVNQHEVAKITLEQAYRDLDKRQSDFINLYQTTRNKLAIDLQSAEQAKQTLKIYQTEFSLGNRPLTDLINAQKDLLNTHIELLNDKKNAYLAIVSLYNLSSDTMAGLETLFGHRG